MRKLIPYAFIAPLFLLLVSCTNDAPLRDRVINSIEEFDEQVERSEIKSDLQDVVKNRSDATSIAKAIEEALIRGANMDNIIEVIDDLDNDADADEIARAIGKIKKIETVKTVISSPPIISVPAKQPVGGGSVGLVPYTRGEIQPTEVVAETPGENPVVVTAESRLPDRTDCHSIKEDNLTNGYRSWEERSWYLANCKSWEASLSSVSSVQSAPKQVAASTPSDPRANCPSAQGMGWNTFGTNGWRYEAQEISFTVPSGTVVDYPDGRANAGQRITGSVFTMYCVATSRTTGIEPGITASSGPQVQGPPTAPPAPPATSAVAVDAATACPTTPAATAALVGGNAANWSGNTQGWKYGPNAPAATLTAPSFGSVNWNGPALRNGQSKDGITEATFYCG